MSSKSKSGHVASRKAEPEDKKKSSKEDRAKAIEEEMAKYKLPVDVSDTGEPLLIRIDRRNYRDLREIIKKDLRYKIIQQILYDEKKKTSRPRKRHQIISMEILLSEKVEYKEKAEEEEES